MYLVKMADRHLPKDLMVESGIPACAAVDAAPIRKLWPLNRDTSRPEEDRVDRIAATRVCRDKGSPDLSKKSGPGVGGRIAK